MASTPQTAKPSLLSRAFNWPILEKSRMQWVDYLRGIAILLVVYRHVLLGIERGGTVVPAALVNANMIFFSFRMPLFFILSGLFIGGSLARKTLGQVITTKFDNLLYPYLIWAFLQITAQIALSRFVNANRSLIDYTYIFYQPRNLDQFWYLPALFNTTLVYLIVKTKLKAPVWSQFVIGLTLYFLGPYVQKISMLSDWMEFYIFFALGDAVSVFFFRESTQAFFKNPWTLVGVTPVFIATQIYYLSHPVNNIEFLVIALIGCFSMFVLSFRLQCWDILRFLRVLGFHSLYIYVMHLMVVGFVRAIMTKVMGIHDPTALLLTGLAFGVTIPVIAYNIFVSRGLWFLFSFRKKEPANNKKGNNNKLSFS